MFICVCGKMIEKQLCVHVYMAYTPCLQQHRRIKQQAGHDSGSARKAGKTSNVYEHSASVNQII